MFGIRDNDKDEDEEDFELCIRNMSCCGVRELEGIDYDNPKLVLKEINYRRRNCNDKPPFYIFTGITNERYGQKLKRYIEKNKFGKVLQSSSKKNPNSHNFISVFVWEVNTKTLDK